MVYNLNKPPTLGIACVCYGMDFHLKYCLKVWSRYDSKMCKKKKSLLFSKETFNLIKSDIKYCTIMLQKISISNKCCSFELSIHQRILPSQEYIK